MEPGGRTQPGEPFRAPLLHQIFSEGRHVGYLLVRGCGGLPGLDQVELPPGMLVQDSVPVRRRPDGVLELALPEAA